MAIEKNIIVETKDVGPIREKKNIKLAKNFKPNGSKPPWGEVPFDLDKWLDEIDPGGWMDEDKPNGNGVKREGLESLDVFSKLASAKDDFNFYYQILSKYYAPSDLHGKSLDQLDRMLQMFIRSNGGQI